MSVTVRLYDLNGLLIDAFEPTSQCKYSTRLPGGCDELTITLDDEFSQRWGEFETPFARVAEVTDASGEVVWSGRLARPAIGQDVTEVRYVGWWYSLWDTIYGKAGAGFASPTYPDDVLKDVLGVSAPLLNRATRLIERNAVDLAVSGGLTFTAADRAGEVVTRLLQIASSGGDQWWAAVWGDRKLRYWQQLVDPKWFISVTDLDNTWKFELSWEDVWSSVQVEFTGLDGVRTVSGIYHDGKTEQLLGYDRLQRLVLPDRALYATTAVDRIAHLYLREHRRPKQRTSQFVVKGPDVYDYGNNPVPATQVRAGDVLRIVDLPVSGDLYNGDPDELRTFHLIRTEYDAQTRTLWLTPDQAADTLDVLLARALSSLI